MRSWMPVLMLSMGLMACGDEDSVDSGAAADSGAADSGAVDSGDPPGLTGACQLAAQELGCAGCYDGAVTCTYGEESVTTASCGDCQARIALWDQLCEAGIEDSRAEIESGLTCSDPVF